MEPYAHFDCSVRSSCCGNAIFIARHPSGVEVTCASCSGPVDRATGASLRRRGPLAWDEAAMRALQRHLVSRKAVSDRRFKREILGKEVA
ncbi:MAG: hypothetical protein FJ039_02190 [Chloroflexi bacterium]|nr:hypothetical protein [Chloroflexota bacterium]